VKIKKKEIPGESWEFANFGRTLL